MPRARRPVRRPAAMDARIRSRRASHRRQAIPDRLSFCRKETETPYPLSHRSFVNSWCFRVFVFATGAGEWICVYLLDLRFLQAGERLCILCASVVFRTGQEIQATRRTACMVKPSPSGLGRMRRPPAEVGIHGTPAGTWASRLSTSNPSGRSATTPSFSSGSTEQVV